MRSPVTETVEPRVEDLAFDDALAELQRTVAELEAGGQPLERALALHERGTALIERCDRLLTDAQLRLQQLVQRAGGGSELRDVRPDESVDEAGT
jgi:exodeoxyribonuclease VII small subunit